MLFANKDEVAAELKCGICHLPWAPESAKACPTCDTLFCETCLSDHYQKDSKCPACTTEIPDFASLRSAPRPLRSMAERSVIVKCPNRPATCWSGPWGQLASHLKDCPFNPDLVVYAEEIPDELQCAICLNVLDSPVTAPCCEQTFCNKCITASLSKRAECPHCRAALSDALLTEPRQSLTKMINRLKVRCPSQCGWVGEKAHVTAHLPLCTERVVVSAPVETTRAAPPAAAEPAPAVVTPAPAAAVAAVPAAAVAVPPAPTVASGPAIAMTTRNYHATVHESNTIVPFYTMAHIKAASAPETSERKHLQISAVMDISGSMGTDKMRMAKEALKFVVNELKPTDRFGLIAFDDKVEARLPLTDMSRLGQANAEAAINGLVARGGTNLSSGLFAGIAQVRDMPFVNPRAARHIDATRSPPPAAAVNSNATTSSGILSRLANLATRKPQATPRSSVVTPPPSVFDDQDELYASQATAASLYIPAFPVTVKYTTAQCKRNNDWMTRYTFEVASTLPRGVAHVSVRHPTHGKITLRGPATFGLLPSGLTDFFVDVVFDREVNHTESIPITLTVDEDGVGQTTVTTQAYGTAPVPRTRIVMLFTDGQANEGITNPTELTDRTNAILAKMPEKDVTVITFGFGSDHNGALLSLIAEKSQGTYYYVENSARIKEVFADCIGGLLSIMATELTLTIKPALGIRISEVMTLFPKMPPAADGSVVVKMKDIFADEERDIVVQLDVAPRGVCPAVPIVTWTLRYEQASLPGQQQVLSVDSAVATIDRPFLGSPDAQVDEQINRYRAAHAMAEAQRLAEEGRVNEANVALRAVQACVQTSASANTAYTTRLQSDLDRAVAATASASTWAREGQKQVSRMKSTHAQQRCNVAEDDDEDMYVTKAKVAMRKNARS